ncbi:MAG: SpoVR family protein [Myxococcales bacterium]|nr:SpoVR family protein [Myxococcales bacterium]
MTQFAIKTGLPRYLRVEQEKIEKIAREYGLDFFPTVFEMLTYDQMNEIAAYGGFPNRYPHWRYGMEYERLSKSYEYGLSKIYEMVINNNPSFAYLLEGNSFTDQKLVMCHVFGHVDFFKNNFAFRPTDLDSSGDKTDPIRRAAGEYNPNRKWMDKMANHATAVRRVVDRFGIARVEEFIDVCLSLENLIDAYSRFMVRERSIEVHDEPSEVEVPRLRSKDYMEDFINPEEFLEEQKKKIEADREKLKKYPPEPVQDILAFLLENAPLEKWERLILSIIREEAYYFVPQMQTKVLNEGWACVAPDSLVYTERGLVPMERVVAGDASLVYDGGERLQEIYDRNIIRNHPTITLRTRRGLELTGSNNHRVLMADGETWKRLDELRPGERVAITGAHGFGPEQQVPIAWQPKTRISLDDVAADAGVSVWTVLRHRAGRSTRSAAAVAAALESYETAENLGGRHRNRRPVRIPEKLDAKLGAFLGYLIGDGHISRVKRHLGLTTGDETQAVEFAFLAGELFGVFPVLKWDDGRWRVLVHSETVSDFLTEFAGLATGPSARVKRIPDAILRSPEHVVRAFLAAYFDCDAYAGPAGVILSSASRALVGQTQLLLLNFGVLSRIRANEDGTHHLHITGQSAERFHERVGFTLDRKTRALEAYLADHKWFLKEDWTDEVVALDPGVSDVYDISVTETHRYVAQGFVNHNSFWHSRLMTERVADPSDIIDYAENNAGVMATSGGRLNPYKLGVELLRHIEERWNKGQFGREWDECDDLDQKRSWDLRLGLGTKKIFEVRQLYTDVTFIDEFLTPEFVIEQKLFSFGWSNRNERFEIDTREFKAVKEKLLFQLTNFGNPYIYVVDANFENKGELLLQHDHRGVDLRSDYAKETLQALVRIWKRPVVLATVLDNKPALLRFDGKEHSVRNDATP